MSLLAVKRYILAIVMALSAFIASAQTIPSVAISVSATDSEQNEIGGTTACEGSAPIVARFSFVASDADDWNMTYEWRFAHTGGSLDDPYMIRYEAEPEVTFTQANADTIALYVTFTQAGHEDVVYRSEYWRSGAAITITPYESELVFPNAFSPNDDGINDTYKPKAYKSIVSFKAMIFNRWGQKLYTWTDVTSDGWDGKFNGTPVKQGVYFVLVEARGADGREFKIKKDVNLLRSYTETTTNSGN